MRKLLMAAVLANVALGASAHAESALAQALVVSGHKELPEVAPVSAQIRVMPYVARFTQWPGFTPNPVTVVTTIFVDGSVWHSTQGRRAGQTTWVEIARIPADRIKALKAAVGRINPQDLRDLDEGQPKCTDAPSRAYEVLKGSENVAIARWASCHRYEMESSQEARAIRELLEGLEAFGGLN